MVAHGHAAGDLDVDELIDIFGLCCYGCSIVRYQFENNVSPLCRGVWVGDAQRFKAAIEAGHVVLKAKQLPLVHRHHLINTVTKDKAPIHDADLGVGQGGEFAVEVARQGW